MHPREAEKMIKKISIIFNQIEELKVKKELTEEEKKKYEELKKEYEELNAEYDVYCMYG